MLKVLLHDLRTSGIFFLPVAALWAAGALSAWRVGPAFFWWNTGLVAALVSVAHIVEWKSGTALFLNSLPVSRHQVVAGRYAGGALAIAVGSVLSVTVAVGLAAAVSSTGRPWPAWVAPETLLASVAVTASLVAVGLACIFTFGLGPGSTVAATLAVVGGTLVEVLGGVGAEGTAAVSLQDRPAGGIVRLWVVACAEYVGWPMTAAGVVACSAVLLWVSARASSRVHSRREF